MKQWQREQQNDEFQAIENDFEGILSLSGSKQWMILILNDWQRQNCKLQTKNSMGIVSEIASETNNGLEIGERQNCK